MNFVLLCRERIKKSQPLRAEWNIKGRNCGKLITTDPLKNKRSDWQHYTTFPSLAFWRKKITPYRLFVVYAAPAQAGYQLIRNWCTVPRR